MNYDAITTTAIRRELAETIVGGRVQHVHHPDDLSLALEIHAGPRTHWLFLSAEPDAARVHLLPERPARATDRVTPLLLLLRKYVDGGRIEAVDQPPLERVLRFAVTRRSPSGELWRTELIAEIMGRLSNLILLDSDGSVMDSIKRVPPSLNRVRTVLPRHRYDPPPPQDKLDPRTLSSEALARALAAPARSLANALVTQVNACSPLLAREVLLRAHGRVDVPATEADPPAIAAALQRLWQAVAHGTPEPSVAVDEGRVVAFAAYPLRSFPGALPADSISAAVTRFFADRAARPRPPSDEARRRTYRAALAEAQDRLRAKLYSLRQSLVGDDEVQRLRDEGERLLAEQRVEDAQRTFDRYAKVKAAARDVPAMIEGVEHELRYLDEALTLLDLAADSQELAALRAEWSELGYLRAGSPRPAKDRGTRYPGRRRLKEGPSGFRRLKVSGFDVLVGRSGRGNDVLLAKEARPDDVWLHARGVPGAHVVVRSGGRQVPEPVLRRAAALAAGQSRARTAPSVGVDYTLVRYVDRVRGGPPGLANYRGEKTLHVVPESLVDYVTG
ncbi:MAG TPA: NFACT RNA binding domain-containing protein [Chloroflexota bacterium]|nr:NFACT RNA binding domain-containing protein [Chloroflexota bacterium]